MSVVVLLARIMNIEPLTEYATQVVTTRSRLAGHLLPNSKEASTANPDAIPPECLLDFNAISECLRDAGKDIRQLISLQVAYNCHGFKI